MLALLALSVAPVQLPDAGWVVFDQPAVDGSTRIGCHDNGRASLRDDRFNGWNINVGAPEVPQRTFDHVRVFVELRSSDVRQVRVFTPDCRIDGAAEAQRIEASPSQAIELFQRVLSGNPRDELESETVAALAHLDHAGADSVLERTAANLDRQDAAHDALFWLAQRRGETGRQTVAAHTADNWPLEHREHAVMALALCRHPVAQGTVAEIARKATPAALRAQAVMALGITDAPNALADVHSIFLVDSDPAVREQAIFAISQIEGEEAARILADIIRQPRFGEHRRTALFWLAQMSEGDSEAVLDELLGEVL